MKLIMNPYFLVISFFIGALALLCRLIVSGMSLIDQLNTEKEIHGIEKTIKLNNSDLYAWSLVIMQTHTFMFQVLGTSLSYVYFKQLITFKMAVKAIFPLKLIFLAVLSLYVIGNLIYGTKLAIKQYKNDKHDKNISRGSFIADCICYVLFVLLELGFVIIAILILFKLL